MYPVIEVNGHAHELVHLEVEVHVPQRVHQALQAHRIDVQEVRDLGELQIHVRERDLGDSVCRRGIIVERCTL
jgi:hypothetical protein